MSEQRNAYKGRSLRACLRFAFRNATGLSADVQLIVDTGSPMGLILNPTLFDEYVFDLGKPTATNFGPMETGWFQLQMSGGGAAEVVRGYRSEPVGKMAAKSHPDFAGLVGLPILRLGVYGGDAADFWFRPPHPQPPGSP